MATGKVEGKHTDTYGPCPACAAGLPGHPKVNGFDVSVFNKEPSQVDPATLEHFVGWGPCPACAAGRPGHPKVDQKTEAEPATFVLTDMKLQSPIDWKWTASDTIDVKVPCVPLTRAVSSTTTRMASSAAINKSSPLKHQADIWGPCPACVAGIPGHPESWLTPAMIKRADETETVTSSFFRSSEILWVPLDVVMEVESPHTTLSDVVDTHAENDMPLLGESDDDNKVDLITHIRYQTYRLTTTEARIKRGLACLADTSISSDQRADMKSHVAYLQQLQSVLKTCVEKFNAVVAASTAGGGGAPPAKLLVDDAVINDIALAHPNPPLPLLTPQKRDDLDRSCPAFKEYLSSGALTTGEMMRMESEGPIMDRLDDHGHIDIIPYLHHATRGVQRFENRVNFAAAHLATRDAGRDDEETRVKLQTLVMCMQARREALKDNETRLKAIAIALSPSGGALPTRLLVPYDLITDVNREVAAAHPVPPLPPWLDEVFDRVVQEGVAAARPAATTGTAAEKATTATASPASMKIGCIGFRLCGMELSPEQAKRLDGLCVACYHRTSSQKGHLETLPVAHSEKKDAKSACEHCRTHPRDMRFRECGHSFCVKCLQYVFRGYEVDAYHAARVAFVPWMNECPICTKRPLAFDSLEDFQACAQTMMDH